MSRFTCCCADALRVLEILMRNVLQVLNSLLEIIGALTLVWLRGSEIYRILKLSEIHWGVETCHTYRILCSSKLNHFVLILIVWIFSISKNEFILFILISKLHFLNVSIEHPILIILLIIILNFLLLLKIIIRWSSIRRLVRVITIFFIFI